MAALSSIAKGTGGIIVVFAAFIQIVKRVKTSPTEAAEALAQTLLWILREHGATIAATLIATAAIGAAATCCSRPARRTRTRTQPPTTHNPRPPASLRPPASAQPHCGGVCFCVSSVGRHHSTPTTRCDCAVTVPWLCRGCAVAVP